MINYKKHARPVTYYSKPSTLGLTLIYTVPDHHTSELLCLHVANTEAGVTLFSLEITNARTGEIMNVYDLVSMATQSVLTVDNLHIFLGPNDTVRIKSNVINKLAVLMSFNEIYDTNKTHAHGA